MSNETIARLMDALESENKARAATFDATMKLLGQALRKEPEMGTANKGGVPVTVSMGQLPRVNSSERVRKVLMKIVGPFDLRRVVRELISDAKKSPGEISPERVERWRYSEPIRRIISNEINKMRYAKLLRVVEPGAGRRGGVYERVAGVA